MNLETRLATLQFRHSRGFGHDGCSKMPAMKALRLIVMSLALDLDSAL